MAKQDQVLEDDGENDGKLYGIQRYDEFIQDTQRVKMRYAFYSTFGSKWCLYGENMDNKA